MSSTEHSWWGGYGLPPLEEQQAVWLQPGEQWPQPELHGRYVAARRELCALALDAVAAAGGDTSAPQWRDAWQARHALGVRLWREERYCDERLAWA